LIDGIKDCLEATKPVGQLVYLPRRFAGISIKLDLDALPLQLVGVALEQLQLTVKAAAVSVKPQRGRPQAVFAGHPPVIFGASG
jgi:hypothetical protein